MDENLDILISSRRLIDNRAQISNELTTLICEFNGIKVTGAEVAAYDQTMESASAIVDKKTLEIQKFLDRTSKRELKQMKSHLERIDRANRQFHDIVDTIRRRVSLNTQKYESMTIPHKKYSFYDVNFLTGIVSNIDKATEIIDVTLKDILTALEIVKTGRLDSVPAIEFIKSKNMKSENGRVMNDLARVDNIIGLDNMKKEMKDFVTNKIVVNNPKFEDFMNYLNMLDDFVQNMFKETISVTIDINDKIDKTTTKIYKYRKNNFMKYKYRGGDTYTLGSYEADTSKSTLDNRHDIADVYTSLQITLMSAVRAYIDLVMMLTTNIGVMFKDSKEILTMKAFVMARG